MVKVERTIAWNTMTPAEYRGFIVSTLRGASRYWKPKQECIKKARVGYNQYKCAICWTVWPSKLPPLPWKKRKRHNITADHIEEVVDPEKGWESYDRFIERLFVEEDGFQALCYECNHKKTQGNQTIRRETKKLNSLTKNKNG